MMLKLRTIAIFTLLFTGGCASGLPGLRPLTYASPGEARIFTSGDKCVHEASGKEFGGLVAAALTAGASQLFKNFGTALSEGAKGGKLPNSIAMQNLELEPGTVPKCVVIIRGSFEPDGAASQPVPSNALFRLRPDDAEGSARAEALSIPSVYRVDHVIELRMISSADGKALAYAPLYMRLDRSLDGARQGKRDLSVELKFNRPGVEPVGGPILVPNRQIGVPSDWPAAASGRYPIEAPWFGSFHAEGDAAGSESAASLPPTTKPGAAAQDPVQIRGPQPGTPPDAGPVGASGPGTGGGTIGAPGSTSIATQSVSSTSVPVTLTATVVETRPTKDGLAFIAAVFNGLQPAIDERLKPLFDTDARQAARATDATNELEVESEYATAYGAAQGARIAYCETASIEQTSAGKQDRITKSVQARDAQAKANIAAIKAARSKPYPRLLEVSYEAPSLKNGWFCS